ncbi:hypothetical protein ACIGQF_17845, partial [Streptomyces sp. NPDC053560]
MCGRWRWAGPSSWASWALCTSGRRRSGTAVAEQQSTDLEQPAVEATAVAEERIPTVIADDLHIVYRVYGTGAGRGSATA